MYIYIYVYIYIYMYSGDPQAVSCSALNQRISMIFGGPGLTYPEH